MLPHRSGPGLLGPTATAPREEGAGWGEGWARFSGARPSVRTPVPLLRPSFPTRMSPLPLAWLAVETGLPVPASHTHIHAPGLFREKTLDTAAVKAVGGRSLYPGCPARYDVLPGLTSLTPALRGTGLWRATCRGRLFWPPVKSFACALWPQRAARRASRSDLL